VRIVAAVAVLAAAGFATWLAWIAYGVLCEEGCPGRSWPLVAQLVAACAGLPLAVLAAQAIAAGARRRARLAILATGLAYLAWALMLLLSV